MSSVVLWVLISRPDIRPNCSKMCRRLGADMSGDVIKSKMSSAKRQSRSSELGGFMAKTKSKGESGHPYLVPLAMEIRPVTSVMDIGF